MHTHHMRDNVLTHCKQRKLHHQFSRGELSETYTAKLRPSRSGTLTRWNTLPNWVAQTPSLSETHCAKLRYTDAVLHSETHWQTALHRRPHSERNTLPNCVTQPPSLRVKPTAKLYFSGTLTQIETHGQTALLRQPHSERNTPPNWVAQAPSFTAKLLRCPQFFFKQASSIQRWHPSISRSLLKKTTTPFF